MSARRTALAVLPLALLAACGGSSDKATSTPSPTPAGLSKAAYIAASEAICTKANADIDAVPAPASVKDFPTSLQSTLTIADKATTDLEALGAKQADSTELTKTFLGPLRAQVTAIRAFLPKVAEAAAKGQAAVEALDEPKVPEADLAAMRAYGFTACVKSAEND